MPGLFDGMRNSMKGIHANRILQEVAGNNASRASDKTYTRQEARIREQTPIFDGQHFLGQGSNVEEVIRIRDELVDEQIRNSTSNQKLFETQSTWISRIETAFNEPSETGVRSALSQFWESWSEMSQNPESFATRASVINHTKNLTTLVQDLSSKLGDFEDQIDVELERELSQVNSLTEEIAQLNEDIFEIEAGRGAAANELRDRRDAALEEFSEYMDLEIHVQKNGMVNVAVGRHPVVIEDHAEPLSSRKHPQDITKLQLVWQYGDVASTNMKGKLGGLLAVRDDVLASYRSDLDSLAKDLITEANKIYSKGVAMEGESIMESRLGYEALGVGKTTEVLNLVNAGEYGAMHVSFYNDKKEVVRTASVVIDNGDSLQDIANKFNNIPGLSGALLSDIENDGRLSLQFDPNSTGNLSGEKSFSISNNTGGYDTSGFLQLLGFDEAGKSTNTSATAPIMASRDLSELQTILQEPDITQVRAKALGLSGHFTINAYDTNKESAGKTDGIHVQQLRIDVESTDSIDLIMGKINTLTAQHGVSVSYNGVSQKLEITSTGETDAEGNLAVASGGSRVRLAFFNGYTHPANPNDPPPKNYNGLGDNTDLMATLQMNTLFQGDKAANIALDNRITDVDELNAGYKLTASSNQMSLDLNALQHKKISSGSKFTLQEGYEDLIAKIGSDIQKMERLDTNENFLREGFITERDRVSGVNLDEELANMLLYQRSYEANARMLKTFNEFAQEILGLI